MVCFHFRLTPDIFRQHFLKQDEPGLQVGAVLRAARKAAIRQEREHLRSLIELTEAKKVTTKTIKSLDNLAAMGDREVSSLADSIRARLDTEDARLDMATRNISDQIEEAVRGGEIERQLEERRKRLLGSSGGGESSASSS